MRRHGDERVRTALRDVAAPGEGHAEERGWAVVREAFAEREPQPRIRSAPRAALALVATGLVAAFALTPAGADVREWIADALEPGVEDAKPTLASLPAPGSLLVEAETGAWVVHEDGSKRRLGDYEHATWSPHGIHVAVSTGRELLAVDAHGAVRWSLPVPQGPVTAIDWSSDEGFRVAYVTGRELRVVWGDGANDARVASRVGRAAPAWRPEDSPASAQLHQLAYVDAANRIVLIEADSGRELWQSAEFTTPIHSLQWSADGARLLASAAGSAALLDARGEPVLKGGLALQATASTLAPDGEHVAVIRPSARGGAELVLSEVGFDGKERRLYSVGPELGDTRFGSPVFSPDGEWIVLPWRDASQWLFVRIADRQIRSVADVGRLFDPGNLGEASFPEISGWCC